MGFPGGSVVKNPPANAALIQEDPTYCRATEQPGLCATETETLEQTFSLESVVLQKLQAPDW